MENHSPEQFQNILQATNDGNHQELRKLLKQNPILVNCQDSHGNSPLIYAVIKDRVDLITLLIEEGGDLFVRNKFGQNALYFCKGSRRAQEVLRIREARTSEAISLSRAEKDEINVCKGLFAILTHEKNRQNMHKNSAIHRQKVAVSLRITRDTSKRFCARIITTALESVGVSFCEIQHIFDMTIHAVDSRQRIRINQRIDSKMEYQRSLQLIAEKEVSAELELKRQRDEAERQRLLKQKVEEERRKAIEKKVAEETAKSEMLLVAKVKRDQLIAEINSLKSSKSQHELKQKIATFGRMRIAARKI